MKTLKKKKQVAGEEKKELRMNSVTQMTENMRKQALLWTESIPSHTHTLNSVLALK